MEEREPVPAATGVSDRLMRRTLDAAPHGIVITDATAADNPIVYANDAFARLTGYDVDAVLGQNCGFLRGPETSADRAATLRDAVDAGDSASTVIRHYRRDGTLFWNHVEIVPLTDDDGTVTRFASFHHDVTDSKRRERDLERRQQRFESLHEASRQFMNAESITDVARIATDAAKHTLDFPITVLRFVDTGGEQLRPTAATAESVAEAGERPDYRVDDAAPAATVYRTGETRIYDDFDEVDDGYDRGDLRSGMYLPLEEYGVMSICDTEPAAFDETDLQTAGVLAKLAAGAVSRLESERAIQRRNERLERFANIVAHDLRNPLGIARGRLELARETSDDDDLDAVARAQERMSSLIDDLLTLAREGGTVTDDDAEPLELARVARDCWRLVETPGARLVIDDTRTLRADEGRLRRLLENLFRNSVEHGSTESRAQPGDSEASETPRTAGDAGDSVEHGSTNNRPVAGDSVEHGSTESRAMPGDSEASETPRTAGEAGDSVEHGSTNNRPEAGDSVEHGDPAPESAADDLTVSVGVVEDFVRSAAATSPDRTRTLGFYVEDDGVGIPPERRDRVFDDGYSTQSAGTGFGLSIVEEIADAHDWTVRVTESAGGGARFEFTGVERESSDPNEPDPPIGADR
jgi:PAS domain S-box-containing protein